MVTWAQSICYILNCKSFHLIGICHLKITALHIHSVSHPLVNLEVGDWIEILVSVALVSLPRGGHWLPQQQSPMLQYITAGHLASVQSLTDRGESFPEGLYCILCNWRVLISLTPAGHAPQQLKVQPNNVFLHKMSNAVTSLAGDMNNSLG